MDVELILCPPKYLSATIPNNEWMKDIPEDLRKIDTKIAEEQFFNLYSLLTQEALVWLLPPKEGLQDQVYATNAGVILPHLDKTCILSKFKAEGRKGEELVLKKFLEQMDYDIFKCPYYFEGEAELKWVQDNIYLGGYGIRTSKKALEWIEENFDAKIIKIKETDPYLYHLDCWVFPIGLNSAIISEDIPKKTKEEISLVIPKIYWVDKDLQYAGITNSVRVGFTLFNADNSSAYSPINAPRFGYSEETAKEALEVEQRKNQTLINICQELGLEPVFVELTEFLKSGALLSCMILHLKRDKL